MDSYIHSVLVDKGSQVFTVNVGATVRHAVRSMNEKRIGALVVVDGRGYPVGMFTERDVLQRVVDADRDANVTLVEEVMTRDLVTIAPATPVPDAMALMTERRMRHLPVLDGNELIGLISIGDLTRWVGLRKDDLLRSFEDYVSGQRVSHPAAGGTPGPIRAR